MRDPGSLPFLAMSVHEPYSERIVKQWTKRSD